MKIQKALVFLDEAYVEFADRNLAELVRNTIILLGRTFPRHSGLQVYG